MPIGKPFGRRPQQKSSKLYEDRIANAGKLPVEKPSLSPIASLMAFAVCLVAAGVFCITSEQVVVGMRASSCLAWSPPWPWSPWQSSW